MQQECAQTLQTVSQRCSCPCPIAYCPADVHLVLKGSGSCRDQMYISRATRNETRTAAAPYTVSDRTPNTWIKTPVTDTTPQLTAQSNQFQNKPRHFAGFFETLQCVHIRPKPSACNRRPRRLEVSQTPTLHYFQNVTPTAAVHPVLYLYTHVPRPGSASSCVCVWDTLEQLPGPNLSLRSGAHPLQSNTAVGSNWVGQLSQAIRHCAVDPAASHTAAPTSE